MKLTFLVGLAVALAALFGTLRPGLAAEPRYEPVDVFIQPAQPPGINAAILPPGTYYAVQPDGVRLSGIIHAPGISGYAVLSRPRPDLPPRTDILKHNPGLRFVPVDPKLPGTTQARPSR
jgi:hypothetical protein